MLFQKPFEFNSLLNEDGAGPTTKRSDTTHVVVYHPRIFRNLLNKSGILNTEFGVNIKLAHPMSANNLCSMRSKC